MKSSLRALIEKLHPWGPYIPISKREYFLHIVLFFDLVFILFLNSYEAFLPKVFSGASFLFDMMQYINSLIVYFNSSCRIL